MVASQIVEEARRVLGSVGAFIGVGPGGPPIDEQLVAIQRVERAGYAAVWTNEIIGTDALVRSALWLGTTDELVVGTCIANMWARPAATAHAAATDLQAAYPGRFVLGLGVGNPDQAASVGREYGSPLTTSREYLAAMPEPTYPRVLGANGPKLLALAAEMTDGALPVGAPPAATERAREALGPDRLLVVYSPVRANDSGDAVTQRTSEHLAAGADHVIVGMSFGTDLNLAVERLEHLAP